MRSISKKWEMKAWNNRGRHMIRVACVLVFPFLLSYHLWSALKRSVLDTIDNFRMEISANWHDFMEFWVFTGKKLGPEYFDEKGE